MAQPAGGMHGDGEAWAAPGALWRVHTGEHIPQPGQHMGRGNSQQRCMFTACEPHLPGSGLGWAKSGQSRAGAAAGLWEPMESATSRLGQELCHAAQHQQGSSAAELGCCRAYITLVVRLLPAPAGLAAPVLPGWGGHPSPLLVSHTPSQGVVQGDARGIGTRHPPAA